MSSVVKVIHDYNTRAWNLQQLWHWVVVSSQEIPMLVADLEKLNRIKMALAEYTMGRRSRAELDYFLEEIVKEKRSRNRVRND